MKKLLMFFLPLAAFLAGCEKENGNSKKDGPFDRVVKSIDITAKGDQDYSSTLSYELKYDSKNRLTDAVIFYNGNEQSHAKWSYSVNSVKMIDLYDDDYCIEWIFNSRGVVNEQVFYYGEDSEYVTKYYYGNDGYLNSKIETWDQYGGYTEYTYTRESGNVVLCTYEDGYGKSKYMYTYTDYTDKANIDLMAIICVDLLEYPYPCNGAEMDKNIFKSLGNKNLIKTVVEDGEDDWRWSFAYEFDDYGYVTRIDLYMDKQLNGSVTVRYQ